MRSQEVFNYVQEEMQKEVARQFALLADDTWHTVDAAQSIEDVESQVRQHIHALECDCLKQSLRRV